MRGGGILTGRHGRPAPLGRFIAVVAAVAMGCSTASTSPSLPPGAPPSAVASAAPTGSLTPASPSALAGVRTVLSFDSEVFGIEAHGDTLWVESGTPEQPQLFRVDARTGTIGASIPGAGPMVVGDELWYTAGDELVAADADTGAERRRVLPPRLGAFGVADLELWIASESTHTLLRYRPDSGQPPVEIPLPLGEPKAVVMYADAVWVAIDGANVLVRVDPATNQVTDTIDVGPRPHSVAVGFGSLWITDHGVAWLVRVDPTAVAIVKKVEKVGLNVGVTTTADSVWAATPNGIAEVDPASNGVVRTFDWGPSDYHDIAAAAGSVWVTDVKAHSVYEVPTE